MVLKINHCSVYTTDIDWDHNHVRDHLEASNFKELSADCFQKSHSMLEAGSSTLCVKMKWPTSCHCKRSVVTTFLQTLCEQDGIDRYGWQQSYASMVSTHNPMRAGWHRPLWMATTVYETANCSGDGHEPVLNFKYCFMF